MQNALKAEIKRLSKRVIKKSADQAAKDAEYRSKFTLRTGSPAIVSSRSPLPTIHHRHFDPIYCARNANFLSKTIWHKVLTLRYSPVPAVNYLIPKPGGGKRSIMAFAIPDAALANVALRRMRGRNLKRMSPHSYAYHPDKNVFDTIIALKDFPPDKKMFAVQIDFEKYFDNIPGGYLSGLLDDQSLCSVTLHEKHILDEFMHHQHEVSSSYGVTPFKRRFRGTPQGSSVSLFLANLANSELDKSLSVTSGKFVRFADDVVALCESYADAQKIEERFLGHCYSSGLILNKSKSPGVAIIDEIPQEIRSFGHFDYLGYRFTRQGLTVPDKVVERIKAKISRLANIYLLYYPSRYGFNRSRCRSSSRSPSYDWDLLGFVSEVRGYMYGGLFEIEIRQFLENGRQLRQMRGLMGFYALLEEREVLRELDGWLVSFVRRAMAKRADILWSRYRKRGLKPTNLELIHGTWLDRRAWVGDEPPDCRMPSFVRGWRASRKYYLTFGLEGVEPPNYFAYY